MTRTNLINATVKLIVAGSLSFNFVELEEFDDLLGMLNSAAPEWMVGRTAISSHTKKAFISTKSKLITQLAEVEKVSLTCDLWTSPNVRSVLGITVHYVDPASFQLKDLLLDIVEVEGNHSGSNIASYMLESLRSFDLIDSVYCLTTDNASNNDTMSRVLQENLPGYTTKDNLLGCAGHIFNLAAKEALAPLSAKASDNLACAIPATLTDLLSAQYSGDYARTLIGKLRATANKMRKSPQSRQRFSQIVESHRRAGNKVEGNCLLSDVATRWNSSYFMAQRALRLRPCVEIWEVSENITPNQRITAEEWEMCGAIVKMLAPLDEATNLLSQSTNSSSISLLLITYRALLDGMQTQLKSFDYRNLKPALEGAIKKLQEYYDSKISTKPIYKLATVLDPRFKLHPFVKDKDNIEEIKALIQTAALKYEAQDVGHLDRSPDSDTDNTSSSMIGQYFSKRRRVGGISAELSEYLQEETVAVISCPNPLDFWSQRQGSFPILAKFARIVLAVPATSTPSERAFSLGGITMTDRRASMSIETLKVLMCLNSWKRQGYYKLGDQ